MLGIILGVIMWAVGKQMEADLRTHAQLTADEVDDLEQWYDEVDARNDAADVSRWENEGGR